MEDQKKRVYDALDKLKIKNFKCFSDVTFELSSLNLLAGSNGCGKSSVIQALLLLRQSFEQYGSLNIYYF